VEDATGLHVTPRDEQAVAAAVAALLDDPERREALGRAGRKRAETRYTWQKVAADSERVYERLIAGATGPSAVAGVGGVAAGSATGTTARAGRRTRTTHTTERTAR